MVSKQSVEEQLNRLGFNYHSWVNRAEIRELPHILLPDEEIYECVNGYYEAGFALLIATNVRVLLIDKKPLNYLNVEDMRFDMINQLDYSHRMMGAQISISAGNKLLKFRSYNQQRLRKLISHVQNCMAETKQKQSQHQEGQSQHLEKINQQLQTYLLAQFQSQMEFNQRLREAQLSGSSTMPQPPMVKPGPELADFLYAQSLLREHGMQPDGEPRQEQLTEPMVNSPKEQAATTTPAASPAAAADSRPVQPAWSPRPEAANARAAELYDEARREIFGNKGQLQVTQPEPAAASASLAAAPPVAAPADDSPPAPATPHPLTATIGRGPGMEVNPLRIAYSKLPMALRNRKFGRPSFHAHSQAAHIGPVQPANS